MTNHEISTVPSDLDRLLASWNSHQELRSAGAPIAQLWESRTELDEVRLDVRLAA